MRIIHKGTLLALFLSLSLVMACVTVNVYFPAAKVQKTADKIVDEVYESGEKKKDPSKKDKTSWLGGLLALLGPAPAHAADAASVSNAAIRGLKKEIAARHGQLVSAYDQGAVGIDKKGYLVVRSTKGLPLNQVAKIKRLVKADNQARQRLYREVADALKLNVNQVGQVEKVFAQVWRDKAKGGWWVQDNSGKWRKK